MQKAVQIRQKSLILTFILNSFVLAAESHADSADSIRGKENNHNGNTIQYPKANAPQCGGAILKPLWQVYQSAAVVRIRPPGPGR